MVKLVLMLMSYFVTLITKYGYIILFPLAALEGPLISLAAGFLVYLGYFNFLPAYGILILGDIIPDTIYYYIGRFGNKRKVMEKYGPRLKVVSANFPLVEKLWLSHGRKTMFLSKLAYGLSTPFLVSAGLVNMSLKRFMSYAVPVTLFQYGLIMIIGYYFGHSYERAARYVQHIGIVVAAVTVILIGAYFVARYARRQIINMEQEEK